MMARLELGSRFFEAAKRCCRLNISTTDLPPAGSGNHYRGGAETTHELTSNLDQSSGADHLHFGYLMKSLLHIYFTCKLFCSLISIEPEAAIYMQAHANFWKSAVISISAQTPQEGFP